MKVTLFLMLSFLSAFVFAKESVHLAAAFNIYTCSDGNCLTPISKVSPLTIELAPTSPDSQVLLGRTELSEIQNGISFSAVVQVVKIPTGPNQGYLVQTFLSAFKNGDYIVAKQLGSVLIENLSQINRIDWKDKFSDDDITYAPVVSIGPIN